MKSNVEILGPERDAIYQALDSRIGNTPLVRYQGAVHNGNRLWIKKECDNPFGSHYDRVYIALFRDLEKRGVIRPGDKVIETTTGSAGASFAGIGRELGYDCHVAIPEGGGASQRISYSRIRSYTSFHAGREVC